MSRARRIILPNVPYHVYNRRTDKQCLFFTPAAYEDLLDVVRRAKERYEVRLHAFCFLHTHVHFALSAEEPKELKQFVKWTCETHAVRFRRQTGTRGNGHVYQDRYKSKPVDDAVHYAVLVRYIERNPVEAQLVCRAEDWEWSSLAERISERPTLLDAGPWALPENWLELVNSETTAMHEVPSLLGQTSTFKRVSKAFPEFS